MKKSREYCNLKKVLDEINELKQQPLDNVRDVERRMVKVYQEFHREDMRYYAAEYIDELKLERWSMMWDSFEWTNENIKRLEVANEQLKTAMLDMRRQTIETFEALREWCTPDKDLYVRGTLWVDDMTFEGWEEDEDMQSYLYDIMTSRHYGNFYVNSVGMSYDLRHDEMLTNTSEDYETENSLLYLSDSNSQNPVDNWNEQMPHDKTEHLHLVYAIHNLYEHCHWTLQDILGIHSYSTKIEIDYSPRMKENV